MPLPNLNQQCTARARTTGNRCLNPAAFGCKTCRYHGARRQNTIKSGDHHPNFKHGMRTQAAIEEYRQKVIQLNKLEHHARAKGLIQGPRRRGRKATQDG